MTVNAPTTLEKFFAAIRHDDPFAHSRVEEPAAAEVDVETIHGDEFQKLVELAQQARDHNQGVGAVLGGEPGAGKSHVLARLSRWAGHNDQACLVSFTSLHPSPERLPRFILNRVIGSLTGERTRQFHDTKLYRLVKAVVKEAKRQENVASRSQRQILAAYHKWIDHRIAQDPARAPLFDHSVFTVLLSFYLSANVAHHHSGKDDSLASLAVRWLSGDDLDPDQAQRLGLHREENTGQAVALRDDEEIRKVLFALTQLALFHKQPFVLCFDEVDHLDKDRIGALYQFLHGLLDHCGNLFVVCSGVPDLLAWFRKHGFIADTAWNCLSKNEIRLLPIRRLAARRILEARLKQFLVPFRDLAEIKDRCLEDSLFPLGRSWFDLWLRNMMEMRPREILIWAQQRWRQLQGLLTSPTAPAWLEPGSDEVHEPPRPARQPPNAKLLAAAIDHKVDLLIAEHKAQCRLFPHILPPSADNLAGLIQRLLLQCLIGRDRYSLSGIESSPRPPYDMIVWQRRGKEGPDTSTGLRCVTTGSSVAAALALRRLLADDQPPDQVLLVTDERQPLPLNAEGQKYLDELRQRGPARFQHVELNWDDHAQLDALQAVAGLARSGDLGIELPGEIIQPVSEREVVQSHHRQGRHAAHSLLRLLLGSERGQEAAQNNNPGPDGMLALNEKDLRQFILAHVAPPGVSSHELCVKYVDHLQVTRRLRIDVAECKPHVEEVVRKMHHDGTVSATPREDGLFLVPRKN